MPANYVLLEKITVGAATASSVTFSGIPQTGYTDLVVKFSARSNYASVFDHMAIFFNGDTANNYVTRWLYGDGSSAASGNQSATNSIQPRFTVPGSSATASTFGNGEMYLPNYTSANFKSQSWDTVTENNATTAYAAMNAGLWSNTAAINSIQINPYFGSWIQGSTFYLYGVARLGTTPAIVPYATGGDIIDTDGTYWYHTFLSSGTFTPQKALSADCLVVAGGGGGGVYIAGGGGAGGFRTFTAQSLATTPYTVTVGAGGAGGTSSNGGNGSNSVFATNTSTGGGGGGQGGSAGSAGGSGGGGSYFSSAGGAGNTPSTSPSQGNNGGGGAGTADGGGGGGGASAAGTARSSGGSGGGGGNGTASSLSGSSVTYAGGGGGGANGFPAGTGGTGGGGAGGWGNSLIVPTAGTANRGGGGGGGSANNGAIYENGAAGGSGIVVIRYAV